LIRDTDCDGFRVDTVRHVEASFWAPWCSAIRDYAGSLGKKNFLMFGEVADRDDELLAAYTGGQDRRAFDSLLDFPFYYALKDVFSSNAPTHLLTGRFEKLAHPPYSREALSQMVTFIDNHDQPRFLAKEEAAGNVVKLRQALVLLYTTTGIPCLYYGTEQSFKGGHDPFNREDMMSRSPGEHVTDFFNPQHPLYRFIADLNEIRRAHPALRSGSQNILRDDARGPGLFLFSRSQGGDFVLVILNTAEESRQLPKTKIPLSRRAVLRCVSGNAPIIRLTSAGEIPAMKVPAGAAWIFSIASASR
jgi:glycosidase